MIDICQFSYFQTGPAGLSTSGLVLGAVARRRRKVARMVFIVVLVFAVTWLPIHVFHLCFVFMDNFPRTEVSYDVKVREFADVFLFVLIDAL